uniref:Prolyl 4-hydroxylase alpha subunit domain-containing protein n=1 Tax=Cannabis sativa TaxID=3483 RepID=A0A803NNT0_CANSA
MAHHHRHGILILIRGLDYMDHPVVPRESFLVKYPYAHNGILPGRLESQPLAESRASMRGSSYRTDLIEEFRVPSGLGPDLLIWSESGLLNDLQQSWLVACCMDFISRILKSVGENQEPMVHGQTGESSIQVIPFQILSWKPRALYFPGFATAEQCQKIIEMAKVNLKPSTLALRKGETDESTKGTRTSSGTFISASEDNTGILSVIEEKIARVTMLPTTHGEAFNILRYEIGQKYDSHYDAFNPAEYGPQKSQRVASFLLYLTDVEEGGETMFPFENGLDISFGFDYKKCIGLKVKPRRGKAFAHMRCIYTIIQPLNSGLKLGFHSSLNIRFIFLLEASKFQFSAMDLGCLDMGCTSVSDKVSSLHSDNKENDAAEPLTATSKIGKNKHFKENSQSIMGSLSKFTSQIKKPGHRKASPINWFPRKKPDSYLDRKIKMLQEVSGMNLTLDETLGDSNPHYSRVLKEKMAAKEAANKAIEARKAALVEASWCRILKAARIQCKEAEAQLEKAEKSAAEAFETALAVGVIMYDIPNCPRKTCHVETSSSREGSTTHAVTASFETAFEVDIEVAAAVKTALVKLANCPSMKKDEFKDLLRKISQNPDTNENDEEQSDSPKSESKLETASRKDGISPDLDGKTPVSKLRQRKSKRRLSSEKLSMTKLVNMMFDRLQRLQENELSSLATIVATCGLNAALTEIQNNKQDDSVSTANSGIGLQRRLSSWGAGKLETFKDGNTKRKQAEQELPSLDKFLVKHVTKLEREVQEARNNRQKASNVGTVEHASPSDEKVDSNNSETSSFVNEKRSAEDCKMGHKSSRGDDTTSSEVIPDLGSMLVKRSSKLEKEVEEARRNCSRRIEAPNKAAISRVKEDIAELPITVELERSSSPDSDEGLMEKDNADLNKEAEVSLEQNEVDQNTKAPTTESEDGLDKVMVKTVHRLEREKMQALVNSRYDKPQNKHRGNIVPEYESLDKVLIKHVSRLEKEKMKLVSEEDASMKVMKVKANVNPKMAEAGGLDQVMVKHKSRLEMEKLNAAHKPEEDHIKSFVSRREAREKKLNEAWEGLSLGNSMRPHLSKLEREKAAWIKAEEEERQAKHSTD